MYGIKYVARQTKQAKFLHRDPPFYRLFPQRPLRFGRVLIRRTDHRPKSDCDDYLYRHGAEFIKNAIYYRPYRPPKKTYGAMYRCKQLLNEDIKLFNAMIDRLHPAFIAGRRFFYI